MAPRTEIDIDKIKQVIQSCTGRINSYGQLTHGLTRLYSKMYSIIRKLKGGRFCRGLAGFGIYLGREVFLSGRKGHRHTGDKRVTRNVNRAFSQVFAE